MAGSFVSSGEGMVEQAVPRLAMNKGGVGRKGVPTQAGRQPAVISILRSFFLALELLGSVTFRTPFENAAFTLSAST